LAQASPGLKIATRTSLNQPAKFMAFSCAEAQAVFSTKSPVPLLQGCTPKDILLRRAPPAVVRSAFQSLAPPPLPAPFARSRSTSLLEENLCTDEVVDAVVGSRGRSQSTPRTVAERRCVVAGMRVFVAQSIRHVELGSSKTGISLVLAPDMMAPLHGKHGKSSTQEITSRQWLRQRLSKRSKDRRALRIPSEVLRAPVPSNDELLAGAAALAYRPRQAKTANEEGEKIDAEAKIRANFDEIRRCFIRKYGHKVESAGLGVISPAPVHRDIMERFLDMVHTYGSQALTLGYHGTPERNLPSIFRRGLLAGRKGTDVPIENGSAHGRGIYLAEAGAHILSQNFLRGSSKMLVCGVVDTTTIPLAENQQQDKSRAEVPKPRVLCRGGILAHRQHRRPAVSAAVAFKRQAARPQFLGRQQLYAENKHLRHVGNAMVVSLEALVAPLFVVDPTGPYEVDACNNDPAIGVASEGNSGIDLSPPDNYVDRPMLVGTRRCWDGEAEALIWLPPVAERNHHALVVKRRWARKRRDVERSSLHAEKWREL